MLLKIGTNALYEIGEEVIKLEVWIRSQGARKNIDSCIRFMISTPICQDFTNIFR